MGMAEKELLKANPVENEVSEWPREEGQVLINDNHDKRATEGNEADERAAGLDT
jgi:hypothetical protein